MILNPTTSNPTTIQINGWGIICRLGSSDDDILKNLKCAPIINSYQIGSREIPVSITPEKWLPNKKDKVYELAKIAVDNAIKMSQAPLLPNDTAIIAGCTKGYSATISQHIADDSEPNERVANTNQLNIDLSNHYRLPYIHIPNAACATGAQVLNKAMDLIQADSYKQIIVCMSEASITNEIISAFYQLGVLTTNSEGMLPFDTQHSGFHIGDGSAAIILSKENSTQHPIGAIDAIACATDATHFSDFKNGPKAILQLIDEVLINSNLTMGDVLHLNLHGTATSVNDKMELSLMNQLTARNPNILFSSTKRHTGHLLGTSGLLETVLCLISAKHQWIPSLPIDNPLIGLSENLVVNNAGTSIKSKHFLNVSYGLGSPISVVSGRYY